MDGREARAKVGRPVWRLECWLRNGMMLASTRLIAVKMEKSL